MICKDPFCFVTPNFNTIADVHVPASFISKDTIINAFIVAYNELKQFMISQLLKLKGEMINCDHTFKLASHVGIFKDGKWVPQYDSLFIIQNKHGKVLFWQLIKGTAYSSVCDGIEASKDRNDIT